MTSQKIVPCSNTYNTSLFYTSTTSCIIIPYNNTTITTLFYTSTTTRVIIPCTGRLITSLFHTSITTCTIFLCTDTFSNGICRTITTHCIVLHPHAPTTQTHSISSIVSQSPLGIIVLLSWVILVYVDSIKRDALCAARTQSQSSKEEGDKVNN